MKWQYLEWQPLWREKRGGWRGAGVHAEAAVFSDAEYLDVLRDGAAELVFGCVRAADVEGGGQLVQRQRAHELLEHLRARIKCYDFSLR